MTFLELCQRLRQEVGAAGNGPASIGGQSGEYARLIGWVREAWREIQVERRRWRFAWAQGSVAVEPAFDQYPLPEDFEDWDEPTLRLGDKSLHALSWGEFRDRFRDPKGSVQYVSIAPDSTLRLNAFPESSSEITFEYWRSPQVLEEGGDVPRLPERYHMAIVYRAMLQYGLYENAPEVVQQARMNYRGVISTMEVTQLPEMSFGGPLA
ncbi:hypothetical protein HPA02_27170 [Bisbaumannia pacifica]|uniref:Uncharacterized protein n=1 Tax=Bisbaumannia pacifica TaxID=77098 RepID=A0A510XAH1_9GAMM|nr:hypothetical protein [Halomonas pacifica]GEK48434.1 hypothetical protein HPA02_27170 [Halomonas pacifica]